MPGKEISLTGELHMRSTGFHVTVGALEALKVVGLAYGLYDHAEEFQECRVTLQNGERPALVVQEDRSRHGSPSWVTGRTVTDDPEQIQRYMAFRETLKMVQLARSAQRLGCPAGRPFMRFTWTAANTGIIYLYRGRKTK